MKLEGVGPYDKVIVAPLMIDKTDGAPCTVLAYKRRLMKTEFLNKTVLVTGGTRGIGAAIVKQFYDLNANVLITGTDRKLLKN